MRLLSASASSVIAVALLAGMAPTAKAGSVTYTYTGNDLTTFIGTTGLTGNDSITASVTFSAALGPDLAFTTETPIAWSFTDGVHTVSSTDAGSQSSFEFGTDSNGAIDAWYAAGGDTGVWGMYLTNQSNYEFELLPDFTPYTYNEASEDWSTFESVAFDTTPGSWAEQATTPEPSTMLLIAPGLITLIYRVRSRRRD